MQKNAATLYIKTQFEACHYWKDMPEDHPHAYIRFPHRHIFNVSVELQVEDFDREVEFFTFESHILTPIIVMMLETQHEEQEDGLDYSLPVLPMSVEMMGNFILNKLIAKGIYANSVTVQEDNENYCTVFPTIQ